MHSSVLAGDLLAGRVVLVTGGGTNLGRQAAIELLACGAQVVIAGRREEVLDEAVKQLGDGASSVVGDIRDPDSAAAIIDAVRERHGRFDALVNNAGGQYFVPAEAITPKGWNAVLRLNVGGTLTMMEAAAERGFGADGGVIVNVTVSPHGGMPGMTHTGVARASVEALGSELATRWADRGIAVVSAAVGRFATESLKKYPAVVQRDVESTIPLGRLGTMEEFGWLVALLCSPLGRRFSGSVVSIDGGLDNYNGQWPPTNFTEEGGVPTEARKA